MSYKKKIKNELSIIYIISYIEYKIVVKNKRRTIKLKNDSHTLDNDLNFKNLQEKKMKKVNILI